MPEEYAVGLDMFLSDVSERGTGLKEQAVSRFSVITSGAIVAGLQLFAVD